MRSTSDLYKAYGVGRVVKARGGQAKVRQEEARAAAPLVVLNGGVLVQFRSVPPSRREIAWMAAASEAAILSRVIERDEPRLPAGLARLILRREFPDADRRRMHELLEKAKAKRLTPRERAEAENYERVGRFLSALKSKARTSLRARNGS